MGLRSPAGVYTRYFPSSRLGTTLGISVVPRAFVFVSEEFFFVLTGGTKQ